MSDQERISPYNVKTISTRQEMRIKLGDYKLTKFSKLPLQELYERWDQYQYLDNCPPTPPLTQH